MKYSLNLVPTPSFNHSTASNRKKNKKEINEFKVILKVVEIKVN